MTVKELTNVIFDEVIIYQAKGSFGEYENLYKGDKDDIPLNILEMKVEAVGASKRGVVDIQVF